MAAARHRRLDSRTHGIVRSAAIYFSSSDSNARARSSLPQLAGGFSARGHEHRRLQGCLQMQDLQPTMAPVSVAGSVATAMRPRACSLAHESMPHATRRALATCDPHACAGAEFFHLRRTTTTTRCRPSPSTPLTRERQRRRRDRRRHRCFTASPCSAAMRKSST